MPERRGLQSPFGSAFSAPSALFSCFGSINSTRAKAALARWRGCPMRHRRLWGVYQHCGEKHLHWYGRKPKAAAEAKAKAEDHQS